jgi:hypothetical protein
MFFSKKISFKRVKDIASKTAEATVTKSAETIAQNKKATELTESGMSFVNTVVKRTTNYAHLADRAIHYHLIGFGIVTGFSLMTGIVALGKLGIALQISFLVEREDLILNFAYASFFIAIFVSFIRHYASEDHKRFIEKEKKTLDQELLLKGERLEQEFKVKKQKLENDYREKLKHFEDRIEKHEKRLEEARQDVQKAKEKNVQWFNQLDQKFVAKMWKPKPDDEN